jgi:putative transposase
VASSDFLRTSGFDLLAQKVDLQQSPKNRDTRLKCYPAACYITVMPRSARASRGGYIYHVYNRGYEGEDVFHEEDDYEAFVLGMMRANSQVPMKVLGYCLLPNHFHLLVWTRKDGDLSRWMQWVMTGHVRRYTRIYEAGSNIWQARFRSFPVQEDDHFLQALRYVERNPLRAGVVDRSQDWEWSSLKASKRSTPAGLLADGPLSKPRNWASIVNRAEPQDEVARLRKSLVSGSPYGSDAWTRKTIRAMGNGTSRRSDGRPRKSKK